jgi:hypothetical protein
MTEEEFDDLRRSAFALARHAPAQDDQQSSQRASTSRPLFAHCDSEPEGRRDSSSSSNPGVCGAAADTLATTRGAEGDSVHSRVPAVGTTRGAEGARFSHVLDRGLVRLEITRCLPAPRARFQSAQIRASAPRCRPPPSRSVGPASDPMRELAERASAWTCRRLAKSVRTRRFNWPLHARDSGG